MKQNLSCSQCMEGPWVECHSRQIVNFPKNHPITAKLAPCKYIRMNTQKDLERREDVRIAALVMWEGGRCGNWFQVLAVWEGEWVPVLIVHSAQYWLRFVYFVLFVHCCCIDSSKSFNPTSGLHNFSYSCSTTCLLHAQSRWPGMSNHVAVFYCHILQI